MSREVRQICQWCWFLLHPFHRPIVLRRRETEPCCKCGELTCSGIYVRHEEPS